MRLGHVLYKVEDLPTAVRHFTAEGFRVEYGSRRRPHNALIYFSEGPYIELLERAPVSGFSKFVLRALGKGSVADRFDAWDRSEPGPFEICLETDADDFRRESELLRRHGQRFFSVPSQRTDPHGRRLRWRLLFPLNPALPFSMTPFDIDPKPVGFVHPNGVQRVERVVYRTDRELLPIVEALCRDDGLTLEPSPGPIEIHYHTPG